MEISPHLGRQLCTYSYHSFPEGKILRWNRTRVYSQSQHFRQCFQNTQIFGPAQVRMSFSWKQGSRISLEPLLRVGFPEVCDASHWAVLLYIWDHPGPAGVLHLSSGKYWLQASSLIVPCCPGPTDVLACVCVSHWDNFVLFVFFFLKSHQYY